ncbi:hypothetical protein JR316_0011711 [Psilocybe cubensis]|uniref:Uncharacterized protein n=1 Tax=Psilocybe cubensis TaxID=181762 RepID=A0ACB8GK97_PSICU|nr:hypothetical protein JR316_0011711 [Psilocybe cubensis]KAH9476140.1 hypothetical protein JR316_0011711 [Psilocybe cubensis]
MTNALKRRRIGASSSTETYRDAIPLPDSFATIRSSEGTAEGRVNYSTILSAGAWDEATSWIPQDDNMYSLMPDSTGFDLAVEGDFMDGEDDDIVVPNAEGEQQQDEIQSIPITPAVPGVKAKQSLVSQWNGSSFVDVTLKELGLIIQLNHAGAYCDNPIPCHSKMLILHTNGIHSCNIQYCGCSRAIPPHLQLLRRRIYPATQLAMKSCATFELLRHLHRLALTTKASTYDFYRCLEKSTTNLGIDVPKSRYRALMRMVLQWRHLQMLKWAGRGHDERGAAGTLPGELMVKCPSCPHPGINLPDNWRDAPDNMKFLYAVMICLDANFRLKNQMVSNYSQDPGLGLGLAYMIHRTKYEAYVKSKANENDISTCVGFQALAKANSKFSKGLRYTGVGMGVCGRSEMILGVGNLHKDERYANMDYIFGTILKALTVVSVLASYDIACQWFLNLLRRMQEDWPPEIKPSSDMRFTPAIPKLHASMHKQSHANHDVYSLNLIPGAGQSDGECPERVWGPHNPVGNATKTMGPGARQDTLDDHFGFWNWLKYTSMRITLLKRYRRAVADRNAQVEGHRGLTESVKKENPQLIDVWEKMCIEWELDKFPKDKKKNPYYMPSITLSEAQVKKDLAEKEAKFLAQGGSFQHATTSSMFISLGLELEEAQRRVRRLAKGVGPHSTIRQAGSLTEQRNILSTRIRAWEQLLPVYIPGIVQYQTDHPITTKTSYAEDAVLYLPSSIPEPCRSRICTPGLANIEKELRFAQMSDSLASIRQILIIKSRMIDFKNKNIRGQRDGTRSTTVIDRVHERARFAASKYRSARAAHLALAGDGDWENTYRVLEDKDVRGYQDPDRLRPRVGRQGIYEDGHEPSLNVEVDEDDGINLVNQLRNRRDGTGQTRRTLSWIWTVTMGVRTEEDHDDILRVEWAKSCARVMRAKEEVLLLKEEMRRTLAFLKYKSDWWVEQQSALPGAPKDLVEGISAFAISQAEIQTSLANHFRKLWAAPFSENVEEDVDEDEDEVEEVEDVPLDEDEEDEFENETEEPL